MITHFKLLTK